MAALDILNYDIVEHVLLCAAKDPELTQDHAKEVFKTAVSYRMHRVKDVIIPRINEFSARRAALVGNTDLLEWWRTRGKEVNWDTAFEWAAIGGHVNVLDWIWDRDLVDLVQSSDDDDLNLLKLVNASSSRAGNIQVLEWLDNKGLLKLNVIFFEAISISNWGVLQWCRRHPSFDDTCPWRGAVSAWISAWLYGGYSRDDVIAYIEGVDVLEWLAEDVYGDYVYPRVITAAFNRECSIVIDLLQHKGVKARLDDLFSDDEPTSPSINALLKFPNQTLVDWHEIVAVFLNIKGVLNEMVRAGVKICWETVLADVLQTKPYGWWTFEQWCADNL